MDSFIGTDKCVKFCVKTSHRVNLIENIAVVIRVSIMVFFLGGGLACALLVTRVDLCLSVILPLCI